MTQAQSLKRSKVRTGSTAVEYAIVLGLIVIACIGSIQMLGQNVRQVMQRASGALLEEELNGGGIFGSAVAGPQGGVINEPEVVHVQIPIPVSR